MKNFNEYIIEKLKVTNVQLTLGDIYRIYNINISVSAIFDPGWFVKKIDDIFDTNILYELQNEYTDYFEKYEDNADNKIKNETVKKLCRILINIIFSVPSDMELSDGLKRLIDDCNIPSNKAKLLTFDTYPTSSKLNNSSTKAFKTVNRSLYISTTRLIKSSVRSSAFNSCNLCSHIMHRFLFLQ